MSTHRIAGLRLLILGLCLAPAPIVAAQPNAPVPPATDNRNPDLLANFRRDLVQERVNLGSCTSGIKGVPGCAQTLFTGTPFHIAIGSLAPQNGVAAGLAFAEVYHPTYCAHWLDLTAPPAPGTRNACHWSLTFNADGQASGNASWRAGVYITAARLSSRVPVAHYPGQPRAHYAPRTFTTPSPTVSFYSQSASLNRIFFYGLGPDTLPAARSDFGLSENITGINAIVPITSWFNVAGLTLLGEVNGRFPSVRGSYGDTSPSIEILYNEISAPGLVSQPAYAQTGEGLRLLPAIPAAARLKLNYLAELQQFAAPSNSHYSFRRFTADLDHRLVLYTKDVGKPAAAPPPGSAASARTIPPISPTRDVTGSLSARLLIQESIAGAGSVVPFYLDPTIGGSDINSQSILPSYPDYRFRAPNLLLINGAYEQSLGKIPVGLFLGVDEAKVALRRDDVDFSHLRHSYTAGITIHAGGLPVVYLLFAWGGNEGHHTIANISNSLLAPATRPSLF
ncbi:MAG TPA: hypothetical protein VF126_12365 [Acidobacteriaceae bacterium]